MGPEKDRNNLVGHIRDIIKCRTTGKEGEEHEPRFQQPPLDPRCDAAVRRFLGLHETLGGDTPLQVYEEGPWGLPWVSWAPPPP
jgi:hypothetical protein